MKLTILVDDFNGAEPGFRTAYGFSVLIEKGGKKYLFDTGTRPIDLIHNLSAASIGAKDIDAVLLSHNHNDHANGVQAILDENEDVPVYVHVDWGRPHSFKGGAIPGKNLVVIEQPRALSELQGGIFLTGSSRSSDYGGIYEQACWITTKSTRVLLTGCSHPGLNLFLTAQDTLGLDKDLPLVILGGFHGFRFSKEEAKRLDPQLQAVYCCHCTSHHRRFSAQFGEKCKTLAVGKPLVID